MMKLKKKKRRKRNLGWKKRRKLLDKWKLMIILHMG